jgi:hypothetical protein
MSASDKTSAQLNSLAHVAMSGTPRSPLTSTAAPCGHSGPWRPSPLRLWTTFACRRKRRHTARIACGLGCPATLFWAANLALQGMLGALERKTG